MFVNLSNVNLALSTSSINIPLDQLRNRFEEEIPQDQTVYVSCQVGLRGYLASQILKNNGYSVKNVDGGWKTYSSIYGSNIKVNVETTTNDLGETIIEKENDMVVDEVLDVTGLTCPMPIVKLKKGIDGIESNQILQNYMQLTEEH